MTKFAGMLKSITQHFSHLSFLLLVCVIFFLSTTNAYSAQVTLAWDPPVNDADIAGYKVYYGNSSRNYDTNIDVGNQASYTLSGLVEDKTFFIAVTAYDIYGLESNYSGEVVYNDIINEIIIVNGNPGTSFTGSWLVSSGANPYGTSSLYANSSATYTFEASAINGAHEVSLWWTEWSNRCTVVQVDIYDGSTNIGTVFVNQQKNGGQWYSMGTYTFSGTARVVINSQGGCTTSADACKIGGSPPPTVCPPLPSDGIMDNSSQWTTRTGT